MTKQDATGLPVRACVRWLIRFVASPLSRTRWSNDSLVCLLLLLDAALLFGLKACAFAHARGICHGDLYAHNLMIDGHRGDDGDDGGGRDGGGGGSGGGFATSAGGRRPRVRLCDMGAVSPFHQDIQ